MTADTPSLGHIQDRVDWFVDDDDLGQPAVENWVSSNPNRRPRDLRNYYHYTSAGLHDTEKSLTWQLQEDTNADGVPEEVTDTQMRYQVFVSWVPGGDRASNAAYTVKGGAVKRDRSILS